MCNFPDIHYVNDFQPLQPINGGDGFGPSPKGMFTLLQRENLVGPDFLHGIGNMAELENTVFEMIDGYDGEDDLLERIFYLIEVWGGITGRGLFLRQRFRWHEFAPVYRQLVDRCLEIHEVTDDSCMAVYNAIQSFQEGMGEIHYRGMGIAFITKHTRFWMHRNLPDSMLPIYDSTFSSKLMGKKTTSVRDLLPFWRGMIHKAAQEGVSLTALERQLFNYY